MPISEEWQSVAVRPSTFDGVHASAWSLWVLDHGLPGLPDHLKDGESVPVSWWSGPDTAAVLHLRREPAEGEQAAFTEVDIDLFKRADDFWEWAGGGGSGGWEESALVRVSVPADHADLSGVVGGVDLIAFWGEVGISAAAVEVQQDGQIHQHPIAAPLGWVVVSVMVRRPFKVRVLDAAGRLLTEETAPPADW